MDLSGNLQDLVCTNDTYHFDIGTNKPSKLRTISDFILDWSSSETAANKDPGNEDSSILIHIRENTKLKQYHSGALQVLRAMITEDKIPTEQIVQHVDYLLHVSTLMQAYPLEHVLSYDHAYRQEQFLLGFPWGTVKQELEKEYLYDKHSYLTIDKKETYEECDNTTFSCEALVDDDITVKNEATKDDYERDSCRQVADIGDVREEDTSQEITNAIIEEPDRALHTLKILSKSEGNQREKRKTKIISRPKNKMPFKCNTCDKLFAASSKLEAHMEIHSDERPFACEFCAKTFSLQSSLDLHRISHTADKKRHGCTVCNKRFKCPGEVKIHMNSHTGERPYMCDICAKTYRNPSDLKRHMQSHSADYKRFKCDTCGARYSEKLSLKVHTRIHTGEKPFICDTCGKRFKSNNELGAHKVIHSEQRTHICDICQKGFITAVALRSHKAVHSAKKPFKCDTCDKAFKHSSALTQHKRTHTGERPYKCDQCDKAFKDSGTLRTHKNVHTGEKPFKCDKCDKAFKAISTLSKHQFVHTREKPHVCDVCQEAFKWPFLLTKHMEIHAK